MLSPTSSAFRSGGDHARIIQGPILVLKRALQQIIDQWTYYYLLSSVFFCMCQPKWLLLLLICQYTSISSKPKPTVLSLQFFSCPLWNHSFCLLICYLISENSKSWEIKDSFHLCLLIFSFVCQFNSRIEALVWSSFAND